MHLKLAIVVVCLYGFLGIEGASQLRSISTLIGKAVGRALEVNRSTTKTTAYDSSKASQKWFVMYDKERNVYEFISVSAGFSLDSNFAGNLYMHGYNDGDYQKWRISPTGVITNVATGLVIDSHSTGDPYTKTPNGG